jgi:hypothetical protein
MTVISISSVKSYSAFCQMFGVAFVKLTRYGASGSAGCYREQRLLTGALLSNEG